MAVDYYNKILFEDKTFADLSHDHNPPFVIINASDMALGTRFEFTQDQFDLIRSDLSKFPVPTHWVDPRCTRSCSRI